LKNFLGTTTIIPIEMPVNEDLLRERMQASFPIEKMTEFLCGGRESFLRLQRIKNIVENDPVLRKDDLLYLNRLERYKRGLQMAARRQTLRELHGWSDEETMLCMLVINEFLPTGPHETMFVFCLKYMTSDEQRDKWLPLANNLSMIGSYAQTELGHGSNIQALETTATYLVDSEEFELCSPTLSSVKFWPGGLGKLATHAVVFARLLLPNDPNDQQTKEPVDYGPHAFLVPLRSPKDHRSLPGVEIGDLGPKFYFMMVDNGFLRLSGVRIPRENMLMRVAEVTPQGFYRSPTNGTGKRLIYAAMTWTRLSFVDVSLAALQRATTIAIRYSAVRRQFGTAQRSGRGPTKDAGLSLERQVLDYESQQYRLFPIVAGAYAWSFTRWKTAEMRQRLEAIAAGKKEAYAEQTLSEDHAISCALKVLVSQMTTEGVEQCRLCCGGHGYSQFSGLVEMFGDVSHLITAEGDNWVLAQQTARFLLKTLSLTRSSVKRDHGNEEVPPGKSEDWNARVLTVAGMHYLEHASELAKQRCCPAETAKDMLRSDVQINAYQHRTVRLLLSIADRFLSSTDLRAGDPPEAFFSAWNNSLVDIMHLNHAFAMCYVVSAFVELLELRVRTEFPLLYPVLKLLSDLFALYHMEHDLGDFLCDGFLSAIQTDFLRQSVRTLLSQLRPQAIALVDAFAVSDYTLNSALGRHDGQVYQALLDAARRDPMNANDVVDGFVEYIQPFVHRGAKL